MNKDTNKNIDDIFKNGFENFQQAPPKQNWEQIEDGIDTDIDQQFKSKLHTLKVSPQPKVWKNIEEELPLHPTARRYFSWMTKIAAILVIGMLLAILSDQQKQDKILQTACLAFLENRIKIKTLFSK